MLLDPFIAQVIGQCSDVRLLQALRELYPDIDWTEEQTMPELTKWLHKAAQRPGAALSTGRRNSFNGMTTCALLHVLEVDQPKGPRNRLALAWALLDSAEGKRIVGQVDELESARSEYRRFWHRTNS